MRLVLVGGGLANSLIALRLAATRPEVDWLLLESAAQIGGNHTWSFHETDLSREQNRSLAPMLEASWPAYDVRFAHLRRTLPLGYRSATADRLRAMMAPHAARIRLNASVAAVRPDGVTLADGETITADGVIDGRGYAPSPHLQIAYQKFLGLDVRTRGAHGVARPVIMDASVRQRDGYRFFYLLPFAPDRLLIEETFYSDGAALDPVGLRASVAAYAHDRGLAVEAVLREEMGVLPIALSGDIAAFWDDGPPVARSGLRAALFHPTTGYSLPAAVGFADVVAAARDLSGAALYDLSRGYSIAEWRRAGYYRLLNRFLFRAAEPDNRHALLERFYRLPQGLVARFYAGRSTGYDKARALLGKPPIAISRALKCLFEENTAVVRP